MNAAYRRPAFAPLLAVFFFLLAILACNAPDWNEVQEELDLPTPAPTIAPSFAPDGGGDSPTESPAASPPASDQTFQGSSSKTSFGSSADIFCQVEQPVTLTVHSDGSAELVTSGPSFIDHYNCTSGTDETWYLNGAANSAEQTVTITSCNHGGFSGSGVISYAGGMLTGDAACAYKNGTIAISLALGR